MKTWQGTYILKNFSTGLFSEFPTKIYKYKSIAYLAVYILSIKHIILNTFRFPFDHITDEINIRKI